LCRNQKSLTIKIEFMSTKEVQGKLWSVAPQYWSKYFEPFFAPLYKKTLEELQLNEDVLLLDAGCGSGLFSHMAIATGAQVIGTDAAPGLLEMARERNPRNNFLEEDLESLPFATESFHVVAGFNSFQYAGNFTAALAEAKRVLKPGGRLVVGIWDKPEASEATNVLKTKVGCAILYYSLQDGIKSFLSTGPAAAAMNHANEKMVQQTIARALQSYRLTEDMYHLQNSFLLFIAEK
jgi:SAM-dependent methyltransferase